MYIGVLLMFLEFTENREGHDNLQILDHQTLACELFIPIILCQEVMRVDQFSTKTYFFGFA